MKYNIKKLILTFLIPTYLLTALSCILLTGCSTGNDALVSKTGIYFDTVVTITLYGDSEKYIDECFKMCDRYEALFDSNHPNSEISAINENSKNGSYTTVSDETLELINYGIYYGELSQGRFDITIGNLTKLWDFGSQASSGTNLIPSRDKISENVKHIGYKQIDIQGNDVLITNPFAAIDLGGIAKGFIADKLKAYLLENNIKKGIINLGGNILLIGSKPDGSSYNIGIQKPFESADSTIAVVRTNDKSIVTSGVYERYFYENDVLYHHILDINTGYPVQNELLSVTIISDKSVDGDGLSTCAFLYGLENGIELIESIEHVEAVFVDKDYHLYLTSGLSLKNGYIVINQ